MGCLLDAFTGAYDVLGLGMAAGGDGVFRDLVLARIIEPASKLDSLRVLEETGVAAASYRTVLRRLPAYAKGAFRQQLSAACAAHAGLGPARLVLCDVSTLYFETDAGGGFREPGFPKGALIFGRSPRTIDAYARGRRSTCWCAGGRAVDPGNAGSSTAANHIEATRLSLAQLSRRLRRRVLIRADSAGGTHEFLKWLTVRSRRLHYSVGMTITEDIQEAIGKVPAGAWTPAYDGDGEIRTARGPRTSPACWTWTAGLRECASSCGRSGRTLARSCGSPTSTGTGSPPWPPTRSAASLLTWNCGTGGRPGARTAAPRIPACGTFLRLKG
jgi:Transposase DDE domain group 1